MHVLEEKDVSGFHVAMENATAVEGLQAAHDLNEDVPDLLLLDIRLPFLITAQLLKHIPIIRILHEQA